MRHQIAINSSTELCAFTTVLLAPLPVSHRINELLSVLCTLIRSLELWGAGGMVFLLDVLL